MVGLVERAVAARLSHCADGRSGCAGKTRAPSRRRRCRLANHRSRSRASGRSPERRPRREASARRSAVETTRGRPNSERGGSSGWIARRTPTSSATGTTSLRKAKRLSRIASSSTPWKSPMRRRDRGARLRFGAAGEAGDDVAFKALRFRLRFSWPGAGARPRRARARSRRRRQRA